MLEDRETGDSIMTTPIGVSDLLRKELVMGCLVGQTVTHYVRDTGMFSGARIFMAPLCLSLMVTFGCASVLTPMNPGGAGSLESDEGLVLGRIHLMGGGGERLASPDEPFHTRFHIQWRVRDQALGKEFLVDGLPSDGPFVVKLPSGSYRLTAFSFDTALGIWEASLPASFTVSPQGCTYLGTWELRMKTGFFDGSVSRQVIDQHNVAESDLKTFVNDGLWPPMVTQLGSAEESPLVLTFRTQGTELTSPP